MKTTPLDVLGLPTGHLAATAMDLLLSGCMRVAPRFLPAIEIVSHQPVPEAPLRQAMRRLSQRIPMLSSYFQEGPLGSQWVLTSPYSADQSILPQVEISATANISVEQALSLAREEALREPLEAAAGQLLRIHRFATTDGRFILLLVCHPMVGDPIAWLTIVDELFNQFLRAQNSKVASGEPHPQAGSSRSLSRIILQQPRITGFSMWPALSTLLRRGNDLHSLWETNQADSLVVHHSVRVPADGVARLREEAHRSGGNLSDLLVATIARACDRTDLGLCQDRRTNNYLRVGIAMNLRRFSSQSVGIGNFMSVLLPTLELPLPGTLAAMMLQIRSQVQREIEHGDPFRIVVPLNLLGQMPPLVARKMIGHLLSRPFTLSALVFNVGNLELYVPRAAELGIHSLSLYPPASAFLPITMSASSFRGELNLHLAFAKSQVSPEEMTQFTRAIEDSLHAAADI